MFGQVRALWFAKHGRKNVWNARYGRGLFFYGSFASALICKKRKEDNSKSPKASLHGKEDLSLDAKYVESTLRSASFF